MTIKNVLAVAALLCLSAGGGFAEFGVEGPVELHIWLTAKAGQEMALEKTFKNVFYPALSSMPGFRDARMMRKVGTPQYTVRLAFDKESQRVAWVASDKHQAAWPALEKLCSEAKYDGFAIVHP
jgi:heme-degrading monooxygenase HmoA